MKKILSLVACLSLWTIVPAFAQDLKLTSFNLEFHGGTPSDLVAAVDRAIGKPLNVIIPREDADIQIPALNMQNVVAPQLFNALEAASRQEVAVKNGSFSGSGVFGGSYNTYTTDYGFKTADSPVTDTSVWYFFANKPSMPPVISTAPVCRFYQLQGYLERGFTVDDITTAIQTGWKMAGVTAPPALNYHKQTTMLIAFGKPDDLSTIQNVLDTLPSSNATVTQLHQLDNQIASLRETVSQMEKRIANLSRSSEKNSGN